MISFLIIPILTLTAKNDQVYNYTVINKYVPHCW
jgi:hypothetical protein